MRNTEDGGPNPDYPGRQVDREIERLENEVEKLRRALFVSVRLQSHYATLLNGWDGGRRLTFASPEEWMKRLAETPEGMPVYEEH